MNEDEALDRALDSMVVDNIPDENDFVSLGDDFEPSIEDKVELPKEVKEVKQTTNKPVDIVVESHDFSVLPIVEDLLTNLGVVYDEDSFSELDMTDPSSLTSIIEQVIAEKSVANFASPVAKDFNDYIANGGDPYKFMDNYVMEVKYANSDFTNEDVIRDIAIKYHKAVGMDDADAAEAVQDLIDSDTIGKLAPKYAKLLDTNNAKLAEQRKAELANESAMAEQRWQEQLNNQRALIESLESIADIPFKSKQDKQAFIKYIQDEDKDGKTAYQRAFEEDKTLRLRLQMLTYKGVDKGKIMAYAESKVAEVTKANLQKFANYSTAKRTAGKQKSGEFSPGDFIL